MLNPLSDERLSRIFKRSTRNPSLIGTNEGTTIEYKQSFGWLSLSEYLKAMAAFANRDGGYIIFGVKDKPHTLLGLKGKALENFEGIDNQKWSTHIREHFAPEIIWEKRTYVFEGEVYDHQIEDTSFCIFADRFRTCYTDASQQERNRLSCVLCKTE